MFRIQTHSVRLILCRVGSDPVGRASLSTVRSLFEGLEQRRLMAVDFSLQLLHASDFEAGVAALDDAPRYSSVINALKADHPGNTLIVSSGDNYIPGPFFGASADPHLASILGSADKGRGDIEILNAIGVQVSALGNHEFDEGPARIAGVIRASGAYPGANFPYLSSNLDFSAESSLSSLVTSDGQDASSIVGKLARSTVVTVDGEQIGIVGVTTPLLDTISTVGNVGVGGSSNSENMQLLATFVQPSVDALTGAGIDKIILLAHLQDLNNEIELSAFLKDVDIIVGGGSNTRLADTTDRLRIGESAEGDYPLVQTDADGESVLIVNTDGNYKYVGRLVADFDENGEVIFSSIDPTVSGAYATDEQGVIDTGNVAPSARVVEITDALRDVIAAKDGNTFGKTSVFLNGFRGSVRTEETNLGNLTADANLFAAQQTDATTVLSLKNGGGIRDYIGAIDPPTGEFLPPQANTFKEEGEISQLDIENSLRFNNALSVVTLTAEQLLAVVEHGLSGVAPGATPGSFPQIGGFRFSYDASLPAGQRVLSLAVKDDAGNTLDTVVRDGETVGNTLRTYRMVTLSFLADGGDSYPFEDFAAVNPVRFDRVDLLELPASGITDITTPGTEQKAFADYLSANFATVPFAQQDIGMGVDVRIQNVGARSDTVNTPVPTETIQLTKLGTYQAGAFGDGAAEIVAYDFREQRALLVNAGASTLDLIDLSTPGTPSLVKQIDLSAYGFPNSVAIKNGVIAIAVQAPVKTDPGHVVLLDRDGELLNTITVGALPDNVTFTPDGKKIVVANEGEPSNDYSVDPEGSVSIIDLKRGPRFVQTSDVMTAGFRKYNDQRDELIEQGIRIFGPGATVAQDMEPEFIAISPDGRRAWVTLQENNAVAVINLVNGQVRELRPLGLKDYTLPAAGGLMNRPNGLDASDRDDAINIQQWPVFGMFMPDALASFDVNGVNYYITANEGDARDYDTFGEEERLKDLILDPAYFNNPLFLQQDQNAGRLTVSAIDGISENKAFVSELTPDQEVGGSTSEGEGNAVLSLSEDGAQLFVSINVSGIDFGALSGGTGLTSSVDDDAILMHIHNGASGVNGGVVWDIAGDDDVTYIFNSDSTTTINATWDNTDAPIPLSAFESQFQSASGGDEVDFYFNIHTTTNPGGAIRGQISDADAPAYAKIHTYGGRGVSIYRGTGELVYDSGNEFERITAELFPADFNSNNDENDSFDNRSDNKGPEAEGVTTGKIGNKTYAFVGLERIGGVMVYDISTPYAPKFVQYINPREFAGDAEAGTAGDLAPEGLTFVPAYASATGKPLLLVANEVSGTLSIFEINLDGGTTEPTQLQSALAPSTTRTSQSLFGSTEIESDDDTSDLLVSSAAVL